MGLLDRIAATISARANALLDRFDDPLDALDLSYQRLLEARGDVRRGIADVADAYRRLGGESAQLDSTARALAERARTEVALGHDEPAREALARALVLRRGAVQLDSEGAELAGEEEHFHAAAQRLDDEIDVLGARREAIKARRRSGVAPEEANAETEQIREELAVISDAVRRADATVAQMRRRERIIDSLLTSGELENLSLAPRAMAADIARARSDDEVGRQLAALKAGVPGSG
jgi:phage shock protein A